MDYPVSEKLSLSTSFTYNKAEDTWEWNFDDRPQLSYGGVPKPHYDTEAINNDIDTYSDLSYEQYEVTVGGTYNFTKSLYTSLSATYSDFDAKEEYVYGDESGEAIFSYLGIGYNF